MKDEGGTRQSELLNATRIAIAVVEHDGNFLIGLRPSGAVLGGLWEFPGGKVEPDETPEAAAARECLEETRPGDRRDRSL